MKHQTACDLHVHSTFSDGTDTPAQLIALAEDLGLSAIALTDHNSVNGLADFAAAGENSPVEAVCGVELTTGYMGREIHMLGLFLPKACWADVTEYLQERTRLKLESTRDCVANLARAGYDISLQEVLGHDPTVSINRVHIARVLLRKGYVDELQTAFQTLLKPGNGFYTEAPRLPVMDAIAKIREWGGVPVWAHPLLNLQGDLVERFLQEATTCGLVGMETRYPLFDGAQQAYLEQMAQKYRVLPSGGSDYHGGNKPDIAMGSGKGALFVPDAYYRALRGANSDSLV